MRNKVDKLPEKFNVESRSSVLQKQSSSLNSSLANRIRGFLVEPVVSSITDVGDVFLNLLRL